MATRMFANFKKQWARQLCSNISNLQTHYQMLVWVGNNKTAFYKILE